MADATTGTWTEIEWTVLEPDERGAGVPAETRATPYLARCRGMATGPEVGQEVEIRTATGRQLRGRVRELLPGYHHTFGSPLPEWIAMRNAIQGIATAYAERGQTGHDSGRAR
jgi:hypothetical protein